MNPAAILVRRFWTAMVRLSQSAPVRPRAGAVFQRRRSSRTAIACFAVMFLLLNLLAVVAMDEVWPRLRDPEYGIRVEQLNRRIAEHPGRPLAVAIGSSRVSMGLAPAAWEESRPHDPARPDPLLFNMSLVGSGPLMELMTLRRLYADGFRPEMVILEFWPPFLREDGPYYEPSRIDHARLFDADRGLVRDYFDKPAEIEGEMSEDRLNPFYRMRHRLLAQIAPPWQPWSRRFDMAWGNLDAWGWLPGIDEYPPKPDLRRQRLEHCEKIYRAQFQGYTIHPLADRALREAVTLARTNGARVALVYLPEASEFRTWMPAEVERASQEYLASLRRELGLPLINARYWLDDGFLVDGFHLSRRGAAEFTRRFGPALAETFPDAGSEP